MIESVKEIQNLFREIDDFLQGATETEKLKIYVIGGTTLLEQGLKPATKDIDLVVLKGHEFTLFENTLNTLGFKSTKPAPSYIRFNKSIIRVSQGKYEKIFFPIWCKNLLVLRQSPPILPNLASKPEIIISFREITLFKSVFNFGQAPPGKLDETIITI